MFYCLEQKIRSVLIGLDLFWNLFTAFFIELASDIIFFKDTELTSSCQYLSYTIFLISKTINYNRNDGLAVFCREGLLNF